MLRLRPARPDLCQHDSGLLRLYHLLWHLVSLLLGKSVMFVCHSHRRAGTRHRCQSCAYAVPVRHWLSGSVSSLASVKVGTGNVGDGRGGGAGPGSLVCLQRYLSVIKKMWRLGLSVSGGLSALLPVWSRLASQTLGSHTQRSNIWAPCLKTARHRGTPSSWTLAGPDKECRKHTHL